DGTAGLGESGHILRIRYIACIKMQLRHAMVIAVQEGGNLASEIEAAFFIQAAHDAEIHEGQCAIGRQEEIAGVEIGVEIAVVEHMAEETVQQMGRKGAAVMLVEVCFCSAVK